MKNALWFLYKPQDERERELFYHAYARSFNFLVAALMVGYVAFKWLPVDMWCGINYHSLINFCVALIILIAYYLGWKTLEKEEITVNAQFSKKLPSPLVIWGALGLFWVVYIIALLLWKEHYNDIGTWFNISWAIYVRIIAWRSTDKLQTPTRFILVATLPFFTIVLSRTQGGSLFDRVIKSVGLVIIPLIFLISTFTAVFVSSRLLPSPDSSISDSPLKSTYVVNDELEPLIHKGQLFVTIPYKVGQKAIVIGDLIKMKDGLMGQVIEVEAGGFLGFGKKKFTVRTVNNSTKIIEENEILERVQLIPNFQ